MRNDKKNIIADLTYRFALDIIQFSEELQLQKKYNLSNQLFRSGTSIGANVREAQNAESKNDFIHKLKVAAKEADETEYWLMLCNESKSYPSCENLLIQISSIIKVLSKIIASSKQNNQTNGVSEPIEEYIIQTFSNYQINESSN